MAAMTPSEQIESDDDLCPGCDEAKAECSGTYAACMTRPDFDAVHGKLAAFRVPVRTDPTLKPDEFRLGDTKWKVIGVDFAKEPPLAVEWQREYLGRWVAPTDGVFHIEPDPPELKERQLDRVAERQRDEALRAGWDGRNWCWCGCASEIGRCPKATCTRHRLAHLAQSWPAHPLPSWTPTPGYPTAPTKLHEHFVEYVEQHGMPRPDGFEQTKIDEIKAMLTAPVKWKR